MDKKKMENPEFQEIPEIQERVREKKANNILEKIPEKNVRDVLFLLAVIVVAGLLIGTFYQITKKPLKEQKALAEQKVYESVFSEGASFEKMKVKKEEIEKFLQEEGYAVNQAESVILVKDEEETAIGRIYNISSKDGYGETIMVSLGIKKNGIICGMEISGINNWIGLGMEVMDHDFIEQFLYEKAELFTYVADGGNKPYEISGTYTAASTGRAVVNAVNVGVLLNFQSDYLEGRQ